MPDESTTRARIVAEVCGRIAGGESVARCFAKPGEDYPSLATFWRWLFADPELDALYERATERRAEVQAQETADIADEKPEYTPTQFGKRIDPGWEAWRKTRIDTRKWIAASMRPKRWGNRTILAGDTDAPLEIHHTTAAVESKLFPELADTDTPPALGKPDD